MMPSNKTILLKLRKKSSTLTSTPESHSSYLLVSPEPSPDEPPEAVKQSKGEEDVEGLVSFRIAGVQHEDLGLETNLQMYRLHDDKYDSFEKWLLIGDGKGDGGGNDDDQEEKKRFYGIKDLLTNEESEGGSGYWPTYEVCVLLQTRDKSTKMYSWNQHPSLSASHFVDRKVSREYGRHLYIRESRSHSEALEQKRVGLPATGVPVFDLPLPLFPDFTITVPSTSSLSHFQDYIHISQSRPW